MTDRPMIPHDPAKGPPTLETARNVIEEHRETMERLHQPESQAEVCTTIDGMPSAWVTHCPYCLRELHIRMLER